MTEEQVTKAILAALIAENWEIVSYDFPQSGTGKMLHPNNNIPDKTKGGIIPDIVAVKNNVCLFFENKDRVVLGDFVKVSSLIGDNPYSMAIAALLKNHTVDIIYYGVAFPSIKWNKRAKMASSTIDFVMGIDENGKVRFLHNPMSIVL